MKTLNDKKLKDTYSHKEVEDIIKETTTNLVKSSYNHRLCYCEIYDALKNIANITIRYCNKGIEEIWDQSKNEK